MSLVAALGKPKKTEITEKLRQEINKVVSKYIDDGVAELVPGVLFLDEVHMLDLEAFTYLNRSLESTISPICVMATNRGVTAVRGGGGVVAPHGIPGDFLDRLLIVPTHPYKADELHRILKVRAKIEGLQITDGALQSLAQIGLKTSLRYAVQMLAPAALLAETNGRDEVAEEDVDSADELFLH